MATGSEDYKAKVERTEVYNIFKYDSVDNDTTILYTVPAGKSFDLYQCILNIANSTAAIGGASIYIYKWITGATYTKHNLIHASILAGHQTLMNVPFSAALRLTEHDYIEIESNTADLYVSCTVLGIER